jgi:hypothetical protein
VQPSPSLHHHRFVHEYGYTVVLDDGGVPRFADPRGAVVPELPPRRPAPSNLGWSSLVAANGHRGNTTTTNECLWTGERVDYVAAIDALVWADSDRM